MTSPTVAIIGARAAPFTAAPAVMFTLRVIAPGERIHAIAFRCQVQIDARRRRYDGGERQRLYELFGDESQFARQVHAVTWATSSFVVPTFEEQIDTELAVACTYDLELAAAKYLHAVRGGDVPLLFLFTGTIFRVHDGTLSVEPVSWDTESSYPMPAAVWRQTMDQFFPGGGWMRLQAETIDRLQAFRGRCAATSWDEAIDRLLASAQPEISA